MDVGKRSIEGRRGAAAAAVLVLAAGAAISGGAPAGGRPTGTARPAARAITAPAPRVLVEPRLFDPRGVAVGADGTVYATDPSGRIGVGRPDGTHSFLRVAEVPAPVGIAVADDGTLFVGGGSHLAVISPDGTEDPIEIPGLQDPEFLDVDTAGNLYVTDPLADQVHRIAPDRTVDDITPTGVTAISGIDVAEDGTVSVLDVPAGDVVRRAPDGTQTTLDVTGLAAPIDLDVEGDRIAVTQSELGGAPSVLVRDADGSVAPADLQVFHPRGVVLSADGTITVADASDTDCRCPASPGSVQQLPAGGSAKAVDLGDIGGFGSVAATAPRTVLFTSWNGAPAYSDPNPLRRVVGDAAPVDEPTGGADGVAMDAAPDGTIYRSDDRHTITRIAPDGRTSAIDLPTKPGVDAIVDFSVDEQGRLFVALGTGYGYGAYEVIEPLAAGGPKTWYTGDGGGDGAGEDFSALAAGGGHVVVVTADRTGGTVHAWDLDGSGQRSERALPDLINAGPAEVDQAGTLWLISSPASGTRIDEVTSDGQASSFAYEGLANPSALSMGTDGTLYVVDGDLLAFDGVGPTAVPDDAVPPPATPVDGHASFTG